MLIPRNLASRFEGVSVSAYYNKGITCNNNNCTNYKTEYFQEQKIGRHYSLRPDSSVSVWSQTLPKDLINTEYAGEEGVVDDGRRSEGRLCWLLECYRASPQPPPASSSPLAAAYNAGESREWKTELAEHLMTLISLLRIFSGYRVDTATNRYQCIERVWGLEEEMWREGELC